MPFTWCHHLSSANNSLKITHPSNNGTTFVLGLVGDLESTILNHSCAVYFHGTLQLYSFLRGHLTLHPRIPRFLRGPRKRATSAGGQEVSSQPVAILNRGFGSNPRLNAIEIYNLKPTSVFTDVEWVIGRNLASGMAQPSFLSRSKERDFN